LVNLLVVEEPGAVSREEIARVLAPDGVAYLGRGDRRSLSVKPRPETTDDWTHALHDATNNAVARDEVVGPPHHLQWVAGPRNARHHERLASISVVVSARGRLFYIVDEAPTASVLLRPRWMLVARDAYSGVVLWKRKVGRWESHLRAFRSGPPALSRRLVATGDRVYATLSYGAPVAALDAASGETVRTYDGTQGAEEILYDDGVLYVAIAPPPDASASRTGVDPGRTVAAASAATGDVLWSRTEFRPMPTTLAVSGGRLFFLDARGVVALDARTGKDLWRSPREVALRRPGWSAPTLVVHDDVVLCADRDVEPSPDMDEKTGQKIARWLADGGATGELVALSAETGQKLWSCRCAETYHAAIDVFVVDGLVWVGQSRSRTNADFTEGRDLHTGEVKRRIATDEAFETTMPHHRCHRNRATSRYIVTGRTGVEFIDVRSGDCFRHHWTRGTCQFGFLPCNGLLYVPPHACACYIESKLAGFYALAPKREPRAAAGEAAAPLARGPAYDEVSLDERGSAVAAEDEWPTYRHDPSRSGGTTSAVPAELAPLWQANLGGRLTSPVVAEGRAFVASVDTHTLHALDAQRGTPAWEFTAGGRIDSPPTVHRGLVVFGSADGYVYCLRASNGELAWRFRAAPEDRRIVAFGQLESVWPVHGAVLVRDDAAAGSGRAAVYCAAGRSSYLDGGVYLYRLDLATGRKLSERCLYSRDPQTGKQPQEPAMFEMPGALPDVLSSDGPLVYMRKLAFDARTLQPRDTQRHLYSPAGFLNDDWWHRTYWIYGTHFYSGYIGWYFAGREAPAGRLLAFDESSIYGYSYQPGFYRGSTGREYHLFATDRRNQVSQDPPDYARASHDYPHSGQGKFRVQFQWTQESPLLVRAMVLANQTLFVAGPPERALRSVSAFEGKEGAALRAVSAADGTTLREYQLDALPVYDGMAAAHGRLYIATADGRLLCAGGQQEARQRPVAGATFLREPPTDEEPEARRPVEPGLAGYWKLDGHEEETARDSSGLGNDAEVYGRWVKGEFGTCLFLDGTAGALTIADGPHLHFGVSDFSLMFWVKPDRLDTRIMGKERFPKTWWVINLLADGRVELVLGETQAEGKTVRPASKTALATDRWTHLAFVVDRKGAAVRCYVNGALDSTTPIPATLTGSLSVQGTDLVVPSAHKPFVGLFDELRIYKRALTADEVEARWESERPRRSSVSFRDVWQ
ncbi:MAG: PQQ-binding-like beta-propeller repeat protein, partial [Armatimonadota bacterium]